jgi:hypothetical protein
MRTNRLALAGILGVAVYLAVTTLYDRISTKPPACFDIAGIKVVGQCGSRVGFIPVPAHIAEDPVLLQGWIDRHKIAGGTNEGQ